MIYLIGGAPRVGKSIIAKQLAAQTGALFIATDHLPAPVDDLPWLGFHGTAAENILTVSERVKLQIAKADLLRPVIETSIKEGIENNKNLIIEGIHLEPAHVHLLIQEYGTENCRALFMGSKDRGLILNGMAQNADPDNWLKDTSVEVCVQVAEFTVAFSEYVMGEVQKYGFQYFERTEDFERDKICTIEYLFGRRGFILPLK